MLIKADILFPLLVAFAASVIVSPMLIPVLRRRKVGNTERTDGVQSHLKKSGTPTMGGLIFLFGILLASLFYLKSFPRIIPVLLLTFGFGAIGFIDDYLKVELHRSDGLTPGQKMLCQILVTTAFLVYLWIMDSSLLEVRLPFSHGKILSGMWVKLIATPVAYLAVIGTVNGVNLTDGLDGLATNVTVMVALFFTVASSVLGGGIEPVTAAVLGALLGFLLFNVYPAKVFMGDTGSLALGGFVAGAAYMMKMPLYLPIIGLIYVIEVVSDIIQVMYFKKTGGKRFFKMAPFHHHLELCGWSETRICTTFSVVTALLCLLALEGL